MADLDINEPINLRGQVALVTGGGRGLGRAFAQALTAAGAAGAVIARSEEQLAETVGLIAGAGGHAMALPADVTDQHIIEQVVATGEQRLGAVDLLVNNAGMTGPMHGPLWEAEPHWWWRTIEVNLRGPFVCTQAVLPGMIARRHGRIINITSHTVQLLYGSAYSASKAALTQMTNCLAAETKGWGISAFAYMPGGVRTAMIEHLLASPEVHESVRNRHLSYLREGITVDSPERAVQGFMFLASGRADALSGRYMTVWDDQAELLQRVEEIERDDLLTLRVRTLSAPGNLSQRAQSLARGTGG